LGYSRLYLENGWDNLQFAALGIEDANQDARPPAQFANPNPAFKSGLAPIPDFCPKRPKHQ
jgi:hypothetical protein